MYLPVQQDTFYIFFCYPLKTSTQYYENTLRDHTVYLRFIYHFTTASGNIGLRYGCGQLSVVWWGVVGWGEGGGGEGVGMGDGGK